MTATATLTTHARLVADMDAAGRWTSDPGNADRACDGSLVEVERFEPGQRLIECQACHFQIVLDDRQSSSTGTEGW